MNLKIRQMLNKVPEVTLFFWIIKILCTTVGETAADYLNMVLNFGLTGTSLVMSALLAVVMFFQFKANKYIPSVYWLAVVLISIVGTLITDNLTDNLNVPLETTTIVFSILLALSFIIWYALEKTLSINSIDTPRRETFYWLVVLFTFALGTAAGDLTAEKFEIGYLKSIFIFGSIALAAIVYYKMKGTVEHKHESVHAILIFWIAYIFTRPLGASIGDYLSQARVDGGLGLGATTTSVFFLVTILGLVVYLTMARRTDSVRPSKIALGGILIVSIVGFLWLASGNSPLRTKTSVAEEKQTSTSPLGDLTPFIKIAKESLQLVQANDLSGAKSRIKDLETAWDVAEDKLRSMSPDVWGSVDVSIDRVLSKLRSSKPDASACINALKAFIAKTESLSK
jgi:uncharacterized membrane-anchored protein